MVPLGIVFSSVVVFVDTSLDTVRGWMVLVPGVGIALVAVAFWVAATLAVDAAMVELSVVVWV